MHKRNFLGDSLDLPTKFARIVVTDDEGLYLIPDLPKANYTVFVRGHGPMVVRDSDHRMTLSIRREQLCVDIPPSFGQTNALIGCS